MTLETGFTKTRVFIYAECGNLKVLFGGRAFARNISKEKKPEVLRAYIWLYFFMFSIENWLGDFSCGGLVVNNLKEKKLLSNQMNNNHFRLILVRK